MAADNEDFSIDSWIHLTFEEDITSQEKGKIREEEISVTHTNEINDEETNKDNSSLNNTQSQAQSSTQVSFQSSHELKHELENSKEEKEPLLGENKDPVIEKEEKPLEKEETPLVKEEEDELVIQDSTTKEDNFVEQNYSQLSYEECRQLFDDDGRLVKEAILRKALFEGGVHPSWRAHIWKFLFSIYPFHSTQREQQAIDLENRARYKALHERWVVLDKAVNLPDEEPSSDPLEYLLSSDNEDEDEKATRSSVYSFAEQVSNIDTKLSPIDSIHSSSDHTFPDHLSKSTCPYCTHTLRRTGSTILDTESQGLLQILEFPSRVYATRQPVDLDKSYPKSKRVILRDVKRTDRTVHYFSHKRHLRKVHRILHIYAVFHPSIGYCQGMNDILSRFLVVTDSEVDSYWLFCNYMEIKKCDFQESTMMDKIAIVKNLLRELDEELHRFFQISECDDYLFCHRWLLLDFKREFKFPDGLRLLEVISSNYLTVSSDRTLKEIDKVETEEFAAEDGEFRASITNLNKEYSFDVFICVAILILYKSTVTIDRDAASIYGCLNNLAFKMNIDSILSKAENLFFQYCRQSIAKGFKEIDL